MHGGLFNKDDAPLEDIRAVGRVRQLPEEGLLSELLWSDPQPQNGQSESKHDIGKYINNIILFFISIFEYIFCSKSLVWTRCN
jgi:hypothetical protein